MKKNLFKSKYKEKLYCYKSYIIHFSYKYNNNMYYVNRVIILLKTLVYKKDTYTIIFPAKFDFIIIENF